MLRDWRPHAVYQQHLLSVLPRFLDIDRDRLYSLENSISKLYLLNLDLLDMDSTDA
ncbi:MAG: hypothetical protein PWR14_883 [Thermosediminibacterales bacterium]|jgi:hypothetical protein|nr:hypothetical protein [Thermosediminibacterales bacterium]